MEKVLIVLAQVKFSGTGHSWTGSKGNIKLFLISPFQAVPSEKSNIKQKMGAGLLQCEVIMATAFVCVIDRLTVKRK